MSSISSNPSTHRSHAWVGEHPRVSNCVSHDEISESGTKEKEKAGSMRGCVCMCGIERRVVSGSARTLSLSSGREREIERERERERERGRKRERESLSRERVPLPPLADLPCLRSLIQTREGRKQTCLLQVCLQEAVKPATLRKAKAGTRDLQKGTGDLEQIRGRDRRP